MSGLNVGDEVKLLLLERVHAGHVSELRGQYLDGGQRIRFHPAEGAYSAWFELGRIELAYPPDSGVRRQQDYPPGELVQGLHVGLSTADLTRRVSLTEHGLLELTELRSRSQQRRAAGWPVAPDPRPAGSDK
ncbi:MAG TPA: hypothetical protein VFO16_13415 [Pseudonocardiaceae bacterium]|nr:hypothetical protein [Pseudonocardiaceae bacterium]